MDTDRYRIKPGKKIDLAGFPTDEDGGLTKKELKSRLDELTDKLDELQTKLYAQGQRGLLVVLQAMDTAGKDSTVRAVFGPLNAMGIHAWSFKAPSDVERSHDFLWRVHHHVPQKGQIAVFNRSHYEDVLVVRVKGLVPKKTWEARYDHINSFERLLDDEGTTVVKFFLHISKDYQKQRLERRLKLAEKHWKFNPDDLTERERWDDYQEAYEAALQRCSSKEAPWYVVPAENRPFRNVLIAQVLVETLEAMKLDYPKPNFDPTAVVIK
jgi:PPK2 family polyphosphate:nucleotide phosphotransferase